MPYFPKNSGIEGACVLARRSESRNTQRGWSTRAEFAARGSVHPLLSVASSPRQPSGSSEGRVRGYCQTRWCGGRMPNTAGARTATRATCCPSTASAPIPTIRYLHWYRYWYNYVLRPSNSPVSATEWSDSSLKVGQLLTCTCVQGHAHRARSRRQPQDYSETWRGGQWPHRCMYW